LRSCEERERKQKGKEMRRERRRERRLCDLAAVLHARFDEENVVEGCAVGLPGRAFQHEAAILRPPTRMTFLTG
jgi:hypothetical protein